MRVIAQFAIRLVDQDQVGQFDDTALDALQFVAGSRRQHQQEHIDHLGDRRFGLARADRLDQHRVEPGRLADEDRFARAARDPAGLGTAEDGRMKASGARPSSAIRVLSPRIAPPPRFEPGSIASTAIRRPRAMPSSPKRSINVDLPAPGGPEMPRRVAPPQTGRIVSIRILGLKPVIGAGQFDKRQRAGQRPPVAALQQVRKSRNLREVSRG